LFCINEKECVILREEQRLIAFENRLLRRIFDLRGTEESTEGWRNVHNEQLHNLYPPPNIIWAIKSRMR
jgi:hypothetical protein